MLMLRSVLKKRLTEKSRKYDAINEMLAACLIDILFDLEHGSNVLLRNVDKLLPEYITPH
jgi:hypothetical protein